MWQVFNKLYTCECFHLFGKFAEWQTLVVRSCRKGKEFVSRNMFTSRYVIACGLSEFMTNYRRLTGVILYRYVKFAPAAPQKEINCNYIYTLR